MQILCQRRLTAAAHAVTHHDDFADLKELDGKFERSRNTVLAGRRFERRHQSGDIAHHENLARIDIEYLRRIDPAIRTGNHHNLG